MRFVKKINNIEQKQSVINIFPQIPDELANIIGKITIRWAQLERIIITTLTRETGKTGEKFIEEIGNYKGKNIEQLINLLEKNPNYSRYIGLLNKVRKNRNGIHDSIVQDFEGGCFILTNNKNRNHHKVNHKSLVDLSKKIEQLIVELNNFSLDRKKLLNKNGQN